jgi:dipeptidyl aminopeptidase/acylaminoacyl peptidase
VVNSAQGPSQIHTLDLPTGKVTAWTQAVGTAGMNLQAIPDQQIVRWKSFDGRVISGVLSLPPARFTGRRPVVMAMHGGPEGQSKQGWQGRTNYLLEELGVAVLEPNVRGSTGYGKTFLALDNGRLREDSVKDMGSAIDWVATHSRLDGQRVLVTGGSYGGYMALAASTRLASRIAGAMSAVGISNFVSFLENTESYRRDLRRVEYGDERDPAMRAFLTSISPLTHVGQITKPLMVVQGKNDPRVPWTESEQIVRSLQQRGTPVWYLLADNEGHGFARRENSDHYFATLVQFVQSTLKP